MKILIIHASAGAGHQRCAEALEQSIQKFDTHDVTLIDALDQTSPFFKSMYRGIYVTLITKFPPVWGFGCWLADISWLRPVVALARRINNVCMASRLHRYLIDEQFDVIFSTHFLPNEVVSALKRKGAIQSKLICVITDYDVHSFWLGSGVDVFAVAAKETKRTLLKYKVPVDKIHITGIPMDEQFCVDYNKEDLRRQLGIKTDEFTVLIATGSFGIGPIEEIVQKLEHCQAIVVCGNNQKLYERLSQQNLPSVKVCGLVRNMHELMAASDAMITKPGGLSVTEALVSHLPLIFFNAIPGQEEGNVRVLKENGIGMSDCSIDEMVQEVKNMADNPEKLAQARQRIESLARPNAGRDVAALI